MKNFWGNCISVFLIAAVLISCNEQLTPVEGNNGSDESLGKVTIELLTFPYVLDNDPPYTDCVTGDPMQNHGTVMVYVRVITRPNGSWSAKGWIDHYAFGGVTLENTETGDVWTLEHATNPSNEVYKENGFYRFHYHWNERYTLNGQNLHIHFKGYYAEDSQGNITKDVYEYMCN